MKGNDHTFSQMAYSALTHILHEGVRSRRIDVVFDTYREDSINNAVRSNRGGTTGIQLRNMARRQVTGSSNGEGFSAARPIRPNSMFLVAEWKTFKLRQKVNDKQLYMLPARKPYCTSPMISGERLQACSQTKKRLTQESFCMQLIPQHKATELL